MADRYSKFPSSLLSKSSTASTWVPAVQRKIALLSSRVAGMKTRMKAPASPRLSSGPTTRRSASNRPPPRILTASSSSGLILRSAASLLA